ncbi:glycosyltransferase family 4 protein [Nocardioides sp. NPDC057772]|uniref:glycosyltransferase family 4 protein n=1 Tax=Nocardioides sp. NPDC057772 TaxID=3346245 RepID=UPI00366C54BA
MTMRILVHDYSGHPFQAELSRELAARGHQVTHSYCEAYVSGKGDLSGDAENLEVRPIGVGSTIAKTRFASRLVQELRFGVQLARLARDLRPEAVLIANAPIPTLVIAAAVLAVCRIPWVLWHQDVQAVAVRSFAGRQLSVAFLAVAWLIEHGERWCARRSAAVVVIADSFVDVHRRWGTSDKVSVIPNWAPLGDIRPVERDNDWAAEHGLTGTRTLLYSGTLGLKHNPALLVRLVRRVQDRSGEQPVRLVVVNQGPATDVLRTEAQRLGVALTLLPFQPYERLAEVLGSGDVLVVLLEKEAGAFSVPSKTLTYLCAGRPVLGLMPQENLAATLVDAAEGCVMPPEEESLEDAARWVVDVLADPERQRRLGARSRALAEREFALQGCADKFEKILEAARGEIDAVVAEEILTRADRSSSVDLARR